MPTPYDLSPEAAIPTLEAQRIVREVELRLIEEGEVTRWEEEIESHHYLHEARLVGETLRYAAVHEGRWLALLGIASSSYHLRGRDQWIGWSVQQRRERRHLVAQNSRFLILPGPSLPNLASRLLALCAQRVSADFERLHGHGVLLLESFVDPQRFEGTCYRAAGWERLGQSRGFARAGRDFYVAHAQPKELWVKPLGPKAKAWLGQKELPEAWARQAAKPKPRSGLHVAQAGSLFELFWQIKDFRSRLGRRYTIASVLAIAALGVLAGARSYAALADVAAHLNQSQLGRLRCWFQRPTKRYVAPRETTFWRVLSGIDAEKLDLLLGQWIERLDPLAKQALALDGKTLRGACQPDGGQIQLFAAITHSSKTVRGQRLVENRGAGSEISAVAPLLEPLQIDGSVVTLDALHTQTQTARFIVQEKGADYLLTVKANQPALRAKAEQLLGGESFFPSSEHGGKRPRAARRADDRGAGGERGRDRLSLRPADRTHRSTAHPVLAPGGPPPTE